MVRSVLLALLLWSMAVTGQNQPDPCATPPTQTGDVSLQLFLKDGQTVFRQGEIIALTAEYSSSAAKKYYLDTRNYDRSGRLDGMEVLCIDPDSGQDPLSDYFNGAMGFLGGGLGGEQDLSEKPYIINIELNEWRLLSPGSYRLSVLSHRVSVPADGNPYGQNALRPTLRSNEVQFQVVKAEPEWQAEQLAAALSVLDSAEHTSDEAKHAARVLRFLGSDASTRALAQRFWSGNDQPFGWDLKFGLFGSPYRETAIQAMKSALLNPEHPVTQELIQVLATLEMQSDPNLRLPKYDETHKEEWAKTRDAYFAAFNNKISEHTAKVAANLRSKTGQARGVSVSELLQSDVPLGSMARSQLRQVLLDSWNSLPQRRKNELIQYRWEQIGGPELLPILRAIVTGMPNRNRSFDQPDRGSALRRIYELSPEEGRDLILHEISNLQGDIGIDVLGLLPERQLPQIEQPLITKLQPGNGGDIDFQLVERYASARPLPKVKAIYERHRGEWACVPQTAMLRYFLRVAPEYGVAQVRDALTLRHATGCYKYQFTALGEDVARPKIEQIAIAALADPSSEVVRDAVQALSKSGSARAEAPLWARLKKFHETWKDSYDQLHYRPGTQPELLTEIGLEQALVQAITNGQAWFATEDTIDRLREITSPQVQQELDSVLQEIRRGEYGLTLNWWPEGTLSYSIGRYSGKGMAELKQKLAQLPISTRLDLITTVAERKRHNNEFAEVESAAVADGLVLQIQTPR
jgi:hypothetical protein